MFFEVNKLLDIQSLVDGLINNNNKHAYQCLKQLECESNHSAAIYPFFDTFVELVDDLNSYIRTRGIILIAANAKWDVDYKIDEIIDVYLKHIMDEKPITARQCIKTLPLIVNYKPELKECVVNALCKANLEKYKESMQSLVAKDIKKSLEDIRKL